ncbi:MAG TPA: hypothetical protein VGA60_12690 [Kiloniellales bacterium]|jgi:hypothetical protein
MWRILIVMLGLVPLAAAHAQSVTKEIIAYDGITVGFSEQAAKCNLTDSAVLKDYVAGKLDDLLIKENPNSIIHIVLSVSGTNLGLLNTQCATHASLRFETRLRADNIVTADPAVRQAVDKLGEFPIVLWSRGAFGVTPLPQPTEGGPSVKAYESIEEHIDFILARFKEERGN